MQKRLILALLLISILLIPTMALAEQQTTYTYCATIYCELADDFDLNNPTMYYVTLVFNSTYNVQPDNAITYDDLLSMFSSFQTTACAGYVTVDGVSYTDITFVNFYVDSTVAVQSPKLYLEYDDDTSTYVVNWDDTTFVVERPTGSCMLTKLPNNYQYTTIYNSGVTFADGRINPQSNNYRGGYNAGATASNDYSFRSLISACFDVPVNTFVSFFNFDTEGSPIGVNFLPLVTTLLTLSLVIAIAKMFVK